MCSKKSHSKVVAQVVAQVVGGLPLEFESVNFPLSPIVIQTYTNNTCQLLSWLNVVFSL